MIVGIEVGFEQHHIGFVLQLVVISFFRYRFSRFKVNDGARKDVKHVSDSSTVKIGTATMPVVTMLVIIGYAGGDE